MVSLAAPCSPAQRVRPRSQAALLAPARVCEGVACSDLLHECTGAEMDAC
jgi:hypothetical protein